MSAISQPANIARRIVRPKPPCIEWREISANDRAICGGKTAVCATIVANKKAPTRLAARTTAQSRATRQKVDQLGCANKGKISMNYRVLHLLPPMGYYKNIGVQAANS